MLSRLGSGPGLSSHFCNTPSAWYVQIYLMTAAAAPGLWLMFGFRSGLEYYVSLSPNMIQAKKNLVQFSKNDDVKATRLGWGLWFGLGTWLGFGLRNVMLRRPCPCLRVTVSGRSWVELCRRFNRGMS